MNEQKYIPRSTVYWNEKFLCVLTCSGRGMSQHDPSSAQYLLPLNVSDETLGSAVLDALAHSRFLTMDEVAAFFEQKSSQARYEAWVADLLRRYEYRSRRALFKYMLSCGVRKQNNLITFSPSRKDRLEGWGRTKQDIASGMIDEVINADAARVDIGSALRRAMERCK